jgi:hypothetical protein
MTARRAQRVIRKHRLPDYLGAKETTLNVLRDLGLLRLFSMTPGGRAQVATEDNIIELQEAAKEAGSLEALIAKLQQERSEPTDARVSKPRRKMAAAS